jgi:hypothetical protein
MTRITEPEDRLNDFDPAIRHQALAELITRVEVGAVELERERAVVNMHCHSFFSFNAYGHSPTSLAWLGKRRGYRAMGIVDFDVLDGVDEFLNACDRLALRGAAGIETRVFVPEYATEVINSLGEPGICYQMGIGFATGQVPNRIDPSRGVAELGRRSGQRNRDILARINEYLAPVTIDYERDVLPLTPSGHPTERHLAVACIQAAERTVSDPLRFWANRLGFASSKMAAIMADPTHLQKKIRTKLMKRGGVGYVQPESDMFPTLDVFHELIVACGALPCAAWLDGTTPVERDPEAWLQFLLGKGIAALNIIPDRNWNIADPGVKRRNLANLYGIVELARELDLPLNVGTEMNSLGQKLVDDFDAPELAPVRQTFLDGAHFIYGHTHLQRALGLGYQSPWARAHLPSRRARNSFYIRIGHQIPPGKEGQARLRRLHPDLSPEAMLDLLAGGTPYA